jgi:hypothetical protein
MKDCLSDMERSKTLAEKIDEMKGQVEANEEAIREYEATKQHLRKQISNVQDKLFRLQRDFEEKKHTTTLALEELQNEKISLERNLSKEKHQADQNSLLLRQKMEQMKLVEESHERDMEVLRTKYEELNHTVREYHDHMLTVMKGANSQNQNRDASNRQAYTPSATPSTSKSLIPVMTSASPTTPYSPSEKALVPVNLQNQYDDIDDQDYEYDNDNDNNHADTQDQQATKSTYTSTPSASKPSSDGSGYQRNHTPYTRAPSADSATSTTPSHKKTPSKLLSLR